MSYDTSKLVKYNLSLPSRRPLIFARILYWVMSFMALGDAILLGVQFVRSLSYRSEIEPPTPLEWITALVFLVLGVILANIAGNKYRKYFTVVRQGFVINRDTTGGGGANYASDVEWLIAIYGYTYANELVTYWMKVSAGDWDELTKGDLVDYR